MTAIASAWNEIRGSNHWLRSAWGISLLVVALIAIFDLPALPERLLFAVQALLHTAPYVLFAVAAIGYLKATESEALVAKAFIGKENRTIVLAALVGGLAPFCSCEVIPFVAALLAAGTPLSAVMAFWLASPLMDPPAFAITTGALGLEFAVGKTLAAVGIGLAGGFAMKALLFQGIFADPLRPRDSCSSCCGTPREPVVLWDFWKESPRVKVFVDAALENTSFLLKWLTLAYLLESLMIAYIPAATIATVVGGNGIGAIIVGALVGVPAYLNSYAAPPLVDALMHQGMSAGAAMAFMTAGGMTCIPAMAAVFALVKRSVFVTYVAFALIGSVLAGLIFGLYYHTA